MLMNVEDIKLRDIVSHPSTTYVDSSPLPLGQLPNVVIPEEEHLHRNICIKGDRQTSSQGSVYFVKLSESVP